MFSQQHNCLTTHFSDYLPVVKWRGTVIVSILAWSQVTSLAEIAVVGVNGVPWEQIVVNPRGLTWKRWPNSRRCEGRRNVDQWGPTWWVEGNRGGKVWADRASQVNVSSVLWELRSEWGRGRVLGIEQGLTAGWCRAAPWIFDDPVVKPGSVGWHNIVQRKAHTSGIPDGTPDATLGLQIVPYPTLCWKDRSQHSATTRSVPSQDRSLQRGRACTAKAWRTHARFPSSKMTNACIHWFNKNLSITHNVPGTMIDIAGTKVNQIRSLSPKLLLQKAKQRVRTDTFSY